PAYMRRAYRSTGWTSGGAKTLNAGLRAHLHDRFLAAMRADRLGQELLTEVDLRFGVVSRIALVLDHFEPQVIERAAHVVELVLRLDDDLVEAVGDGPRFLLLGERAEKTLAAPVAARAADPGVEHTAAVELHVVLEPVHQ